MAFTDRPFIPHYPQMIMEAIRGLSSKEGATKEAITNFLESNYTDLTPAHLAYVSITLEKMKQSGQLTLMKDETYAINDQFEEEGDEDEELAEEEEDDDDDEPTNGVAPMKRGRGRPPKPKVNATPSGPGPAQSPRPRGRPPKERDPLAPVSAPTKPASSGRPRGRPRKNPSEVGVTVSSGSVSGVKRGRGRPRKS